MLENLFIPTATPPDYGRDSIAEAELNARWGSLFDIYHNKDLAGQGVHATPTNALAFDTVYACINVLSDDIAKLPFKTYKRNEKGAIEQIKDNDVHYVLRVRPNQAMSPFIFMKHLMTDVLRHGNFYALIAYDEKGQIKELLPLSPTETHPVWSQDGMLFYQTNHKGKNTLLFSDEVIHIRGMTNDGVTGISPIESIRTQLESNEVAGRYNRKMLDNGALPQGILTVTGNLNGEAKDKVREHWTKSNIGHSIAIVDSGMEYQQIGISQRDVQWLEGQKYNTQRIASIFKVPLHKINDLDNATYTNIESQSLDYVKNTLQPWVTQIESEFGFKLYSEEEQKNDHYVKFNMDSELRGDSKTRAEVNEINFRNGVLTVNEIRSQNELSPYDMPVADKPMMTLNYAPLENIEMFNNNRYGESLNGKDQDPSVDESDTGGDDSDVGNE